MCDGWRGQGSECECAFEMSWKWRKRNE